MCEYKKNQTIKYILAFVHMISIFDIPWILCWDFIIFHDVYVDKEVGYCPNIIRDIKVKWWSQFNINQTWYQVEQLWLQSFQDQPILSSLSPAQYTFITLKRKNQVALHLLVLNLNIKRNFKKPCHRFQVSKYMDNKFLFKLDGSYMIQEMYTNGLRIEPINDKFIKRYYTRNLI
jgi:hypothetical protein